MSEGVSNLSRIRFPVPDFPSRIEIEPSLSCNLQCVYCPRHYLTDKQGFMAVPLFRKIVDECSFDEKVILVLHRRGESLLHPEFCTLMDLVKGRFKTIQIATNATLLDSEKAKKLIETVSFISFSIDLPGEFAKTRKGGIYRSVRNNILNFLNINQGKVKTQVSMVKTSETSQSMIDEFVCLWRGKVDRIRIYEEHSHKGIFGSLREGRSDRKPCTMPFYEIQVSFNGEVRRCNHDWKGPPLGNLNFQTIREIWLSSPYLELRRQHANLDLQDEVCSKCDSWYPVEGQQSTGEVYE